jgi:hypothetical protein
VSTPALELYVRHAERFGVELVFETALGLGEPRPELTVGELVRLGRRLKTIDPNFDAAKPDTLVELAGADVEAAYLERLRPVLDALSVPAPTRAGRACEWCGRSIAGRADRRTCSKRCREALRRANSVGAFSRPAVALSGEDDLRVVLCESVALTSHEQRGFETKKRGGLEFREVSPALDLGRPREAA